MSRFLRQKVNQILDNRLGLRIHPSPEARLESTRTRLLELFGSRHVIDVGANSGQWAKRLRQSGYSHHIYSFEPSVFYNDLKSSSQNDNYWHVFHSAIADFTGESDFYLSSNHGLSSSLSRPKHILDQPFRIEFTNSERVKVQRLDQVGIEFQNSYLKIDVQGAEMKVLQGATDILHKVSIIEFESSLIELYEEESSHYEIAGWLMQRGFHPRQIVVTHWDKYLSPISIDAIFSRTLTN